MAYGIRSKCRIGDLTSSAGACQVVLSTESLTSQLHNVQQLGSKLYKFTWIVLNWIDVIFIESLFVSNNSVVMWNVSLCVPLFQLLVCSFFHGVSFSCIAFTSSWCTLWHPHALKTYIENIPVSKYWTSLRPNKKSMVSGLRARRLGPVCVFFFFFVFFVVAMNRCPIASSLQQLILYLSHLYYRSFRLVSSLQQLILYLLHLYYKSFRLVSSLEWAYSLFIAFLLQVL